MGPSTQKGEGSGLDNPFAEFFQPYPFPPHPVTCPLQSTRGARFSTQYTDALAKGSRLEASHATSLCTSTSISRGKARWKSTSRTCGRFTMKTKKTQKNVRFPLAFFPPSLSRALVVVDVTSPANNHAQGERLTLAAIAAQ